MSLFEPNAEQRRAIESLAGDVVVSAGAGSGKTAVLARRFVHAVMRDTGGSPALDVSEALTITFTRKAAAELTERIRRVFLAEGATGVVHSRRIDEAWVSTIDAFCARILRRHALEGGVGPEVRYLDELEAGMLQAAAAAAVLSPQGSEARTRLIGASGHDALADSMQRDHARLRSMGRSAHEARIVDPGAVERAAGSAIVAAEELRAEIDSFVELNATQTRNLLTANQVVAACHDARDSEPSAARILAALDGLGFSRAARPKTLATAAKEALAELRQACADRLARPVADEYRRMLCEFSEEYRRLKRDSGLVDFADALEITARLIGEEGSLTDRYREQFRLVMIDEFQDTNEAQMRALGPIAAGRLCAVGDLQQSIYGFRYADVAVMRGLLERADTVIPLPTNYRSHPQILDFVNEVFSRSDFLGEDHLELAPGRTTYALDWPVDRSRVEYVVADMTEADGLPAAHAMAQAVADRVATLTTEGIAPADIVVLMRKMTHASRVGEELETRGVCAHVASGETFLGTPEIADMRAMLRAVVVPDDDAAMAALLLSPVVGFSEDIVSSIRAVADESPGHQRRSLYSGMQAIAENTAAHACPDSSAVAHAYETLNRLKEAQSKMDTAALLHNAVHAFEYDLALLASGSSGSRAWSDVLKLMRIAGEYDSRLAGDVGGFLDYLSQYERYAPKEQAAPSLASSEAVRIMSVHAAKGLEFPVVVLANLQSSLVDTVRSPTLVERMGDEVVLSVRYPADGSALEKTKDSLYESASEYRAALELAEELRILYVACTRAEEMLVLVGACRAEKPTKNTAIARMLEPLGGIAAAGRHRVGDAEVLVRVVTPEQTPDSAPPAQGDDTAPETEVQPDGVSVPDVPARSPVPNAPTRAAENVPKHVSYSSLHLYEQCPFRFHLQVMLGMKRLARGGGGGAAQFGSAVHDALEIVDVRGAQEACDIARRRHALGVEETERMAAAVAAFRASDAARRLSDLGSVQHEQPFEVPLSLTKLTGSMDVLARGGSLAVILDFKTGRSRDLALADGRRAGYSLQADCYALAALESGSEEAEVRFVFVEQGCHEVIERRLQHDAAEIRQRLDGLVGEMAEGRFDSLDRYDQTICSHCVGLGGLCPIDSPDAD